MTKQIEIDYRLFMSARSLWSRGDSLVYNDRLDKLREDVIAKFEVPEWNKTIKYVNHFAESDWAKYPKFTFNSWKAHLKIEKELEIELYPALFTYSYPIKDAGTIGWYMYGKNLIQWGSAWKLSEINKKSNTLFVSDYNNIDCEIRKVDEE